MKLWVAIFGLILGVWLIFPRPICSAPLPNTSAEYIPGEIIVKYKPGRSPEELKAKIFEKQKNGRNLFGAFKNFGRDLGDRLGGQGTTEENLRTLQNLEQQFAIQDREKIFTGNDKKVLGVSSPPDAFQNYSLLTTDPNADIAKAASEFSKSPAVQFAEPNYILHIFATPNDTNYSQLWGMAKIYAPGAWDVSTGSDSIIVAVIDTGINYNHEDLDSSLIIKGPNYAYGTNDPLDDAGHGTHVSGTIGAVGNNNKGVAGVNWKVKILSIKVMDSTGAGSSAAIAQGIKYAADNGARVISMSLGTYYPSAILQEALNYASAKNIVLVAAAGNDHTSQPSYPAGYDQVISVSATDQSDQLAAFSNFGNKIEVGAPGVSILSTVGVGQYPIYYPMSGTSMACPHVAGLAALILAKTPSLTAAQVRSTLTSTADDLGTPGKDNYFGYGRINACRALGGTNCGTNPTGTPTPTVTPGGPTLTPTATPGPTSTPTPTVTPGGPTATPTPTPTAGPTVPPEQKINSLTLGVMLQGINTRKKDKSFTIIIKKESREVTKTQTFSSNDIGIYSGKIILSADNLRTGSFDIFVKTPYFLRKKFSSVSLAAGDNTLTRVGEPDLLRAGDIDNSGVVNALDVSLIKNGYSPFNQTADAADLNLDGYINSLDYSLVLSNYGRRDDEGPLPTPTPTLTPIPSITPRPTSTPSPTTTPKPTATPTPMPTSTPKPTATPTPGLSSGIILFNSSQQTLKEYLTNLSKRRGWYLLSVNTSDPREVKKEILKLTTSNNAIRYLLIIGSEKTIPLLDTTGLIMPYIPGPGSSTSNAVLDNFYYGDIDDDLLVDLAVGRIPTEDLNKIKAYFSQAPPRGTSDIFASHMINQISFRESVCLQENLGMKVTLNGTKEDLLGALDTSSVFGIETHGGPDWWNLKDGTFSSQDIPNLTNHPVVISASCETSAILGKNFLWKGASAYLGYWFINAGFEPTVPIYRKLRLGFPLGEAIKESINRNFADFVVRNHDNFVGADYPSFQTLSITSEKEKLRNSSGRASFAAGILLYGDPSLSIGKTLTEPNILAEKASEITLILPANKYLLGNSDPTGTPVTFCSTNKSDLNQAWLSYLPSENSEGNIFAELPPLVFPLDSGWTSISSGTWKINNQTPFTIPNKVSNYFASLIRGRSQNFLVLHDKLFLKGGLGKEHSIIINASR